ncbi:MAG: ribbon-helix-helix domain-containing protein [Halieaceae bacterium]
MSIFVTNEGVLAHMFNACTTEQINEFIPEKRSLRIQGQSTTVRLERAFWNVLEEIAADHKTTVTGVIQQVADQCLIANDKNLASCLRVICLKYLNIYS